MVENMANDDFFKFNNGKDLRLSNLNADIDLSKISDAKFKKLLSKNIFDTDGNGVLEHRNSKGCDEIANVWNALKSAATKDGNKSLFASEEIKEFMANFGEEVEEEAFTTFFSNMFDKKTDAKNNSLVSSKYTNEKGESVENLITYSEAGNLQKIERKVNGLPFSVTKYAYNNATDENPMGFVTLTTINADGSKVTINVLDVDKNGDFQKEHFIDRTTVDKEGNSTQVYSMQGIIVENKTKVTGKQILTLYNGSEITDYDNLKLNRTLQQTIDNGQVQQVEYDGNGNTKTNLNAGDTKEKLARTALITTLGTEPTSVQIKSWVFEFENLNKRFSKGSYIPQAGESVIVQGEYDADSAFLNGRQAPSEAVTLTNEKLADNFISTLTNEYPLLNQNYSQLSDSQLKLVDKAIEDCFKQNMRKPEDVKANLEKKFPNLNLFNSGKVIYPVAKNDINLVTGDVKPHLDARTMSKQSQNTPLSVESFITKILKLNLKTEPGKTVYQRLANLPQETLSTISAQNFGDMSNCSFNQITDSFGFLQIQTPQENLQKQKSSRYKKEQEHRFYRESAAQNVAIA